MMAPLHERSALQRALVEVTRNPCVLIAFPAAMCAAAYALSHRSLVFTDRAAASRKKDIEEFFRKGKDL